MRMAPATQPGSVSTYLGTTAAERGMRGKGQAGEESRIFHKQHRQRQHERPAGSPHSTLDLAAKTASCEQCGRQIRYLPTCIAWAKQLARTLDQTSRLFRCLTPTETNGLGPYPCMPGLQQTNILRVSFLSPQLPSSQIIVHWHSAHSPLPPCPPSINALSR